MKISIRTSSDDQMTGEGESEGGVAHPDTGQLKEVEPGSSEGHRPASPLGVTEVPLPGVRRHHPPRSQLRTGIGAFWRVGARNPTGQNR